MLKNTCFSNFTTEEPFLMIFSVNHNYKLKDKSSNLSEGSVQED